MFDSSPKYCTKITIGCFIAILGKGVKLRWEILLQNSSEQVFNIVQGFIIAKLGRGDILNCDFFFKTVERDIYNYTRIFYRKTGDRIYFKFR